jgi:Family of unknown function (DUF6502)
MPDNVKKALAVSVRRLLRPLVKIMLREGFTYSQFASIARMAFVDTATKDFVEKGVKSSSASICALTGLTTDELERTVSDQELFEGSYLADTATPAGRVLHGWYNDKDYVGPYGFPFEIPFSEGARSIAELTARHAPGISPHVVLQELKRVKAVTEVGADIWKPLVQEHIEPSLTPENAGRMASLIESLIATLENNTRPDREGTDLFERTVTIDVPLTDRQLLALQSYMKLNGGQLLQRIDSYAAVELQEKVPRLSGDSGAIRAGFSCFLFVEPSTDDVKLRDVVDFSNSIN